jgi:outer membrane lipoprotein-sorting protein
MMAALAAVLLLLGSAAKAPTPPPPSADQLLERLASAGKDVRRLSGDFVQRKHVAAFKQELTSRGHFEFARPSRLEWRYTEPDPSRLVVDGNRATLELPDEAPQTFDLAEQPSLRAILAQMQLWLGGGGDLSRARADYEITLPKPTTLHLVPREKGLRARIASIDVDVDPSSLLPRSVRIAEPGEDSTSITFSNVRRVTK